MLVKGATEGHLVLTWFSWNITGLAQEGLATFSLSRQHARPCHPFAFCASQACFKGWTLLLKLTNAYLHVQPQTSSALLTHWGRDKMVAIFQTTFLKAFSWMKMYKFRLRFHWSLFLRAQLTIFQHWFRPGAKPLLSELMMVSLLTHICVTRLLRVTYSSLGCVAVISYV